MGQLLNLRGEKLQEPQLATALSRALRNADRFGARPAVVPREVPLAEFAAVESLDTSPPHYTVYVECGPHGNLEAGSDASDNASDNAGDDSDAVLSRRLDAALAAESAVYGAWRRKGAVGCAEVARVEWGAFDALREARLAGDSRTPGVAAQQLKASRVLRSGDHAAVLEARRVEKGSDRRRRPAVKEEEKEKARALAQEEAREAPPAVGTPKWLRWWAN